MRLFHRVSTLKLMPFNTSPPFLIGETYIIELDFTLQFAEVRLHFFYP